MDSKKLNEMQADIEFYVKEMKHEIELLEQDRLYWKENYEALKTENKDLKNKLGDLKR